MSFIAGLLCASESQLARDLWPSGLGNPILDTEQKKDLPAWRVVPADYESLCQWLYVDRDEASTPPKVLIHPAHHDVENMELILRMQGIVADVNLNPLGNWNGEVEHAPKALQSLTLTGAACKDAFGAQQRSLANIIELIYKQLCLPPPCGRDAHADIVLKRRVFTKVRPTTQLSSSLTKQDDPTGRAAKIAHQWCAEHRVVVGVQKEDGTIARANPMVIRRGDFVDVAVTLHIVTMRARKVRKTEVFFSPQEVVRLAPAANAARLLKAPRVVAKPEEVRKPAVVRSGFKFVGSGEDAMDTTPAV
ncbi:hypothetical protein VTO73DRAFT_1775 [Trametes versicolor]